MSSLALPGTNNLADTLSAGKEFIPQFKIFYAIENKGDATNHACIVDREKILKLSEPYYLTTLDARKSARQLVVGDDGRSSYIRAYEKGKTADLFNQFAAADEEFQKQFKPWNDVYKKIPVKDPKARKEHERSRPDNNGIEVGVSALVGIWYKDAAILASMDNFKTLRGYWAKILSKAVAAKECRAKINVIDHSVNLSDGAMKFFMGEKFIQYEIDDIPTDESDLMIAVCRDKMDLVNEWRTR